MLTIGIGLTSKCNCGCDHCYSRIYGDNSMLDKDLLFRFIDSHQIESVNFGTGESWFYPDFIQVIHKLHAHNIKISVTTNGYTLSKMCDSDIALLHDVDFSLDYPTAALHDRWRKNPCFQLVTGGVERCKRFGITCSIAWCITPNNYRFAKEMLQLCKKWGVFLRVNIYKPVANKPGFSYETFWDSMNELLTYGDIISSSEGILNAAIRNPNSLSGCSSSSIRIFPNNTMSSCVYVPHQNMTLSTACTMDESELLNHFEDQYSFPNDPVCQSCEDYVYCRSGCMARRKIAGTTRDEFCYKEKNTRPHFERVVYSTTSSNSFVHSNYLCTLILEPRSDLSWT